jgi:hypothetical protein
MDSAGKRTWKRKLEEDKESTEQIMKGTRTLQSGVKVAGMGSKKQKGKSQVQGSAPTVPVTAQNVAFEGLNGTECRKWWQENPDNHPAKASMRRAQVEWAVRMPVFCIREYEGFLRTMIEAYDRFSRTSTFSYLGKNVVISFRAADFTRVFGIPGTQGAKIEYKKIPKEEKLLLIRLVCGDVPVKDQEELAKTSSGRGLRRTSVQEGQWRCLMDVVKSRLTGSSRASDISFPQVSLMNGIMNGRVYDWATLLAERMHEFMTLQHRTFYMPHYAIGLFLDATVRVIPIDKLEVKPTPLAPGEPPIMQWKHLDIAQRSTVAQKRPRMDTAGDTDSGRETSSEADSSGDEYEDDDEEVEVISATPLLFPRPVLSTTAHLSPVGTTHMLGFGQFRQPVTLTPVTVAVPPPVVAQHAIVSPATTTSQAVQVSQPFTVQPVAVPAPASAIGTDTQLSAVPEEDWGVMELPVQEEEPAQTSSGVQLEVIGSDAMVTVDAALLATPDSEEPDGAYMRTYLSRRFNLPTDPVPSVPILSPVREEVIPETVPEETTPAETVVQPVAEPNTSAGQRVEAYLAEMAEMVTRGREVLVAVREDVVASTVAELEKLLIFMRVGCPAAFTDCFEARGWPSEETFEMREAWTFREPTVPDRVEMLIREVRQLYREAYYTLRRSQADLVVAERTREESATKLSAATAAWDSERAALLAQLAGKETQLAAKETQLAATETQLAAAQQESAAKEAEMGSIARMMHTALRRQQQAEVTLEARIKQVHELRAQLRSNTPGNQSSS